MELNRRLNGRRAIVDPARSKPSPRRLAGAGGHGAIARPVNGKEKEKILTINGFGIQEARGVMINNLFRLVEYWEGIARRKFQYAKNEKDNLIHRPTGKQLIEHEAICYVNCARELKEILSNPCYKWPKSISNIYTEALEKLNGDSIPLLFGPGHIVWEDENWDSVEWCLENFEEYKGNYTEKELAIVRWSLEELAKIPIEKRYKEKGKK